VVGAAGADALSVPAVHHAGDSAPVALMTVPTGVGVSASHRCRASIRGHLVRAGSRAGAGGLDVESDRVHTILRGEASRPRCALSDAESLCRLSRQFADEVEVLIGVQHGLADELCSCRDEQIWDGRASMLARVGKQELNL
jgi:hypothetical protein